MLTTEPSNVRGAGGALADLLRDVRRQPCLFRLAHERQRLLHLRVRNQGEKRRLLQLDRQRLPQGVVEYRIAGPVVEIREDNGVSLGQCGSRRGIALQ